MTHLACGMRVRMWLGYLGKEKDMDKKALQVMLGLAIIGLSGAIGIILMCCGVSFEGIHWGLGAFGGTFGGMLIAPAMLNP